MFGVYRTMLAIWVMIFHLLDIPVIGTYAVFSFFVLSGFLMTTIMHETYGYSLYGVIRYAENRCLRLYPMYWLAALVSIAVILLSSSNYAQQYHDALFLPDTLQSIFYNLTMIFPRPIPWTVVPRLSPPTWTITVEIFFYILIGFGISRNVRLIFVWFIITIAYYVYNYVAGLGEEYRYAFVLGASLPFSLGALLYFYKKRILDFLLKNNLSSSKIWLTFYVTNAVLFTLYSHFFHDKFSIVTEIGKYINLGLSLIVTVVLNYGVNVLFSRRIDKYIGDYSYPIYLLHWQAGLLSSALLFSHPSKGHNLDGLISFAISVLILFTLCTVFIWLFNEKIDVIREDIKNKSRVIARVSPVTRQRERRREQV